MKHSRHYKAFFPAGWKNWVHKTSNQAQRLLWPQRLGRTSTSPAQPHPTNQRAVVIINPTKFDHLSWLRAKEVIATSCAHWGWQTPVFLQTTEQDPGWGQSRTALELNPNVVMVCGGDGTTRAVAQALAGTHVPLALLPKGTGNLLARNLGVPLEDLTAAVEVALTGDQRSIDVGWVQFDDHQEQLFLVMTGLGYDAEIMAYAPPLLKARVGPIAYVLSGARKLLGVRVRLHLHVDQQLAHQGRVRTVLVGNCGKIQAGITLMPQARLDDGLLDVLVLSPRGLFDWLGVAQHVLTRPARINRNVGSYQGRQLMAHLAHPQLAQVDGDVVGSAVRFCARVQPGALLMRVPAEPKAHS